MTTSDYKDLLFESLRDKEEAAAYLTACFEDSEDVFLLGLRNVVEANGGVGALAKDTDLNRENLYRLLSKDGNPQLSSLTTILSALGFQIQINFREEQDEAA